MLLSRSFYFLWENKTLMNNLTVCIITILYISKLNSMTIEANVFITP